MNPYEGSEPNGLVDLSPFGLYENAKKQFKIKYGIKSAVDFQGANRNYKTKQKILTEVRRIDHFKKELKDPEVFNVERQSLITLLKTFWNY